MLPRAANIFIATITLATLVACGPDSSSAGPANVVETIGDTTVVRTLSGSVWVGEATLVPEVSIGELDGPEEYLFGRIWSIAVDDSRNVHVFDEQAQHVRVYDSAGVYVETLGGRGEGPGEFSRAEAIAVLPDSRLVVRDPGNQRIEVFGPGAGQTDQWGYNAGNTYSMSPLYTDARSRTFLVARDLSQEGFVMHIIVLGPDGTHVDTLPEPTVAYEPPTLTAEFVTASGSAVTRAGVPFSPAFLWTVHPSGHFLTGLSSEYRIDLSRNDGVLRIERTADPVPVHDEERAGQRERTTRMMRNTDPDWNWNGPPIPEHKPFFQELLAGRDGRIWVRLATEAHPVENEDHDPEDPFSAAVLWEEPVRYDVFEPDGTYLGVVVPPDGFSSFPDPVFDGDHVWAVTTDELGIQRVVRFRVLSGERGDAPSRSGKRWALRQSLTSRKPHAEKRTESAMLSDREILELAERAGKGEREALGRLAGALRPLICRWALVITGDPDDAEDVAQVVLMKTLGSIHSFDGRSRVTSWVYRITRNASLDQQHRKKGAGPRIREQGGMMDHRDDWPDGILEGDLESVEGLDPSARQSVERVVRDARNMDGVLSAMAEQLSESLPAGEFGQPAPARRQPSWKKWTLAPLAAAAAVAALILVRGEGADQSGGLESFAVAPPTTNMMAEMDVEADKPFVVFPTTDPDIAVIWLLNPKESD